MSVGCVHSDGTDACLTADNHAALGALVVAAHVGNLPVEQGARLVEVHQCAEGLTANGRCDGLVRSHKRIGRDVVRQSRRFLNLPCSWRVLGRGVFEAHADMQLERLRAGQNKGRISRGTQEQTYKLTLGVGTSGYSLGGWGSGNLLQRRRTAKLEGLCAILSVVEGTCQVVQISRTLAGIGGSLNRLIVGGRCLVPHQCERSHGLDGCQQSSNVNHVQRLYLYGPTVAGNFGLCSTTNVVLGRSVVSVRRQVHSARGRHAYALELARCAIECQNAKILAF